MKRAVQEYPRGRHAAPEEPTHLRDSYDHSVRAFIIMIALFAVIGLLAVYGVDWLAGLFAGKPPTGVP